MSDDDTQSRHTLPFSLRLDSFSIEHHTGTTTHRDYHSLLYIYGARKEVSMNHEARVGHYRLLQLSYDSDLGGSLLMVRYDPWGQPLTYAAYALLLAGLLLEWGRKDGPWRDALGKLARGTAKALLAAAMGIGMSCQAAAATDEGRPMTVSRAVADEFGRLYVEYGGRVGTVEGMARDLLRKVGGSTTYRGLTATQVWLGWLYRPDEWRSEPLATLKHGPRRTASYDDLMALSTQPAAPDDKAAQKAAEEAAERLQLIREWRSGSLLRLYPTNRGWLTPVTPPDSLPYTTPHRLIATETFTYMTRHLREGNEKALHKDVAQLAGLQQHYGSNLLPSRLETEAESALALCDLPATASPLCLAIGLLLAAIALRRRHRKTHSPLAHIHHKALATAEGLQLAALTAYIALRTMLTHRLPLGNGYETMLALAWALALIGVVTLKWQQRAGLGFMPFVAVGLSLWVAARQTEGVYPSPLQPVLASQWLTLHVSLIMMAYALLAYCCLLGLAGLWQTPTERERQALMVNVLLRPAVVLLCAGIFVGALWADRSWGRYWGWDPKEVWALLTLLTYIVPLHPRIAPQLQRPDALLGYVAAAFSIVVFTFFGVSWLLGGLHAYA